MPKMSPMSNDRLPRTQKTWPPMMSATIPLAPKMIDRLRSASIPPFALTDLPLSAFLSVIVVTLSLGPSMGFATAAGFRTAGETVGELLAENCPGTGGVIVSTTATDLISDMVAGGCLKKYVYFGDEQEQRKSIAAQEIRDVMAVALFRKYGRRTVSQSSRRT